MYYQSLQQVLKMISNFQLILDKAVAFAEAKKFDSANLLNARLAPDQFHLTKQIQSFCDTAKFMPARLTGKEAPKHEDNEKTISELKERIDKVIAYLKEYTPDDFEVTATHKVELPFRKGFYLTAEDYLLEFALPNFYFHITAAYQILRHNGVDIGKMDFLGKVNFQEIEADLNIRSV